MLRPLQIKQLFIGLPHHKIRVGTGRVEKENTTMNIIKKKHEIIQKIIIYDLTTKRYIQVVTS